MFTVSLVPGLRLTAAIFACAIPYATALAEDERQREKYTEQYNNDDSAIALPGRAAVIAIAIKKNDRALQVEALQVRSYVRSTLNDSEGALEDLDEALKIGMKDKETLSQIYNDRGTILIDLRRYEEALADVVAATLRNVGFDDVVVVTDASKEKLTEAVRNFANEANKADWATAYYAGHGIERRGANHLIPIDAKLASDRDVQYEAVPLYQVLLAVEGAKRLRLIVLDACRDGTTRRCWTRRAGHPERSGSSLRQNGACGLPGGCSSRSARTTIQRARISVSSPFHDGYDEPKILPSSSRLI